MDSKVNFLKMTESDLDEAFIHYKSALQPIIEDALGILQQTYSPKSPRPPPSVVATSPEDKYVFISSHFLRRLNLV